MVNVTSTTPPHGIVISTQITAGRIAVNQAEGVVVASDIIAGRLAVNHAEGVV